ncbi:MAG: SMR family transporter [Alphaproteobacteria bacterium]|nr:SMR family transporter [Alphaproteobacteria bacterium]
MQISGLYWLAGGSVLLTVGDIIFKMWAKQTQISYYLSGLLIYMLGLLCLVESFKTHNMAIASAILVIGNIITLAIVSYFFFGEPLTPKQMAGICTSILAVILMV